ncbi:MSMEG_6728 family protein [Herbiconiux sp. L3-i23]|uniref:MSMEG_6728 family protein n=1 Tax=Herbiconiux sp. L3-i23 TaxID=2905871 RepID=UPI00205F50E5|nr:MSMEG_6728 family protein [Herbiconiux sp. L3-i23]BDI22438.1 hypothetical protein L3i23_12140 [Herbiconiux sp. L3-i23]
MQTFLPYADLDASMAVLDQARLGKQRVETLQVLRASLLPTYGWQSHPVTQMWRGFLPGLTAYGLANVREWTARGHVDTTAELIREFAPEVDGLDQAELERRGLLPPWFGDDAVHRSHRSNLIRKDEAFYAPQFPGTPGDLDYFWPGVPAGADRVAVEGDDVRILRAATLHEVDHWREDGLIAIGERSPRGKETPVWRAQVQTFLEELTPGTSVGVLVGNGQFIAQAEVLGEPQALVSEGGDAFFARAAAFAGDWVRADFAVPAQLQDPRSLFSAALRR